MCLCFYRTCGSVSAKLIKITFHMNLITVLVKHVTARKFSLCYNHTLTTLINISRYLFFINNWLGSSCTTCLNAQNNALSLEKHMYFLLPAGTSLPHKLILHTDAGLLVSLVMLELCLWLMACSILIDHLSEKRGKMKKSQYELRRPLNSFIALIMGLHYETISAYWNSPTEVGISSITPPRLRHTVFAGWQIVCKL